MRNGEIMEQDTFVRQIAGRDITFRTWKPGQFTALQRNRSAISKEYRRVVDDKSISERQRLEMLSEILERLDLKTLKFVESLIVSEEDVEFLGDGMLDGSVEMATIMDALFNPVKVPDDDEDPTPKKAAPNPLKKATRAKKTANARRTTR